MEYTWVATYNGFSPQLATGSAFLHLNTTLAASCLARTTRIHRELPSLLASGTVNARIQLLHDPSYDYDQVGNKPDPVICSECEDHPMELRPSNAITFILRTIAQNLDFEFELDPAGDIFIGILPLQDVLPVFLH